VAPAILRIEHKEAPVSWDVWIIRPPEGVEAVSDLRSGDVLASFNRREVHAAAEAAFGRVEAIGGVGSTDTGTSAPGDVVDASTLRIDGPDVYADLSLDDSQDQLMLNVIGGSERLTTVILEFAAHLEARALDLQTGDWLTVEDGEASFAAWGAYKRRVTAPRPDCSPDLQRADRIGEFWANRRVAPSPSCRSIARRIGRSGRCSSACAGD
jgi:hypothetical protein